MTTIERGNKVITLINVFTVAPENQQPLVNTLIKATDEIMKKLPGFVSANIHKSVDGIRVVNYAQWRSREDFESMMKNPEAQSHIKPIMEIAQADAHLYEVVETLSVSGSERPSLQEYR
jgi:heme-degrading monooxygenase HmoA